MRYLEVEDTGELTEKSELVLESEKVLIIVDEEEKKMFLWKGSKCPIRKKFIGSRSLSDLRKAEYGFAYVPQSCDQGEETIDFVLALQKIGKEDLLNEEVREKAQKLIERQSQINVFEAGRPEIDETVLDDDDDNVNLKSRPGQVATSQLPPTIAKMGAPGNRPTPSILSQMSDTGVGFKVQKQEKSIKPKEELEESYKILNGLGVPKGFYRDLVIIGKKVFTETYDGGFEELDEPPEGVFFSRTHVPRMICENGIVRAIEFLKPEEGAELSGEDEKMAQDINDLLAMFEIEID